MAITDDNKLVRLIKLGDKDAFQTLVKKHYSNIYSYCYRSVQNKDIAEDLTQEIFMKLVSSIYNYRFTGKFTNYIFTIAVNTCADYFRKTKHNYEYDYEIETIVSKELSPEELMIKYNEQAVIKHKIDILPDIQKDAIILYYYHDLKAKDIAIITGVPLATVKSRIKQGLDKLKKSYGKDNLNE